MMGRRSRVNQEAQNLSAELVQESTPARQNTRKIGLQDSPYQVKDTDRLILVDTTHGPVEVLLPQTLSNGNSQDLIIKDIANKAHVHPITVTPQGAVLQSGVVQRKITSGNASIWFSI
tara:strand:+ start:598 stop:951 length:354 start_codon:yes stop_codon:yes gene_type:complete